MNLSRVSVVTLTGHVTGVWVRGQWDNNRDKSHDDVCFHLSGFRLQDQLVSLSSKKPLNTWNRGFWDYSRHGYVLAVSISN